MESQFIVGEEINKVEELEKHAKIYNAWSWETKKLG